MLALLMRSFTQAFRVLRNFITRPFFMLKSKMRYMTNLGRYLAKLPSLFTALPRAAMSKPKKRADYVAVGSVFMAKTLLALLLIAIIIIPLLFYFFVWPLLVPLWFTARYTDGDSQYNGYSGKVAIFYDEGKKQQMFTGRLLEGKYTDIGTLYHENGFVMYNGTFTEGLYDIYGREYAEDARMIYEGGFAMGLYHGRGSLYGENGGLLYEGDFDNGVYNGRGELRFPDGSVQYEGGFFLGMYHGHGTLYSRAGVVEYTGFFENGLYHGAGELYDSGGRLVYRGDFEKGAYFGNGRLYRDARLLYEGEFRAGEMSGWGDYFGNHGDKAYSGEFSQGLRSGSGTQYDNAGNILYRGSFADGLYDGQGIIYGASGEIVYEGGFSAGKYSSEGRLVLPDGLIYEGEFRNGAADGTGRLTSDGAVIYSGRFADGFAEGEGTLTHRNSGLSFAGQFEKGRISPDALLKMPPSGIFAAFESGMREDIGETEFHQYNAAFGLALRFEYATEERPAKLTRIVMSAEAMIPRVGGGSLHPYPDAGEERQFPDTRALALLGIVLHDGAAAYSEISGTVLVTTWLSVDGTVPALYVYEDAGEASSLSSNDSTDAGAGGLIRLNADEPPDLEYYLLFGLGELLSPPASANPGAIPGARIAASDAIGAALGRDAEIPAFQAREKDVLEKLYELRTDPMERPNKEISDLISEIHRLWEQSRGRCHDIAADVLNAAIVIDTELQRQAGLEELLGELGAWIDVAQMDFRMSKIDISVLNDLRARHAKTQLDIAESELRLSVSRNRFRELTGFSISDGFDFGSAWMLADVENTEWWNAPGPLPSMLFAMVEGISRPSSGLMAEAWVNSARLELMLLHDALARYATADKTHKSLESLYYMDRIGKFEYFDAVCELLSARIDVYEKKRSYGAAMTALDKHLGGFISSEYYVRPRLWFFEAEWVFEMRVNASYEWMESSDGRWGAARADDDARKLALVISEPWVMPGGISGDIARAALYYEGALLAENGIKDRLVFSPPVFGGESVIEVVFYDGSGEEAGRAYIDGFQNAGRFFEIAQKTEDPPQEEDEPQDGAYEEDRGEE